jgi:hypothetical protein
MFMGILAFNASNSDSSRRGCVVSVKNQEMIKGQPFF